MEGLPPWLQSFLQSLSVRPFQREPNRTERGYAELNRQNEDFVNYAQAPTARPEVAETADRVTLAQAPRPIPTDGGPLPLIAQANTRRRLEERARARAASGAQFEPGSQRFRLGPASSVEVGVHDRRPRPVSDRDVEMEMNQGVSREMAALLDTIAEAEGTTGLPGGGYGSIWGDTPRGDGSRRFTDFSQHPNQLFPGPDGPSSAAGRFQITGSTYRNIADRLGIADFSPQSQTRMAAFLAQDAYGPTLERDLADPTKWEDIARRLSPVWASLPFHPTQRRISTEQFSSMLRERLNNRIAGSPRDASEFISPRLRTRPRPAPAFLPQSRGRPIE